MKAGSFVTFKTLTEEEAENPYSLIFKVIEMRDDRVLVEQVWTRDTIRPTFVYNVSDLRLSFVEHPDIEVPDFIDFDKWMDTSWHNDVTASLEQKINEVYNLKLWIYEADASKREFSGCPRFCVCIVDNEQGYMTNGREAETEEEAQEVIKSVLANHEAFISEMDWS